MNIDCGAVSSPRSEGFFVDGTLAIGCLTESDCGFLSLYCIGGFCTKLCNTEQQNLDDCLSTNSVCVSATASLKTEACHIRLIHFLYVDIVHM